MCLPKAPSIPAPPPPVAAAPPAPVVTDQRVRDSRANNLRRASLARGRDSTIRNSGVSIDTRAADAKTLLGQ